MQGHEGQRHQTQYEMPFQRPITPPLEVRQPDFPFGHAKHVLDLPAMMPPKLEVGWPARPANGPRRVYRAGRGFGCFSFARRFLFAHERGSA
jgi:hypothetical protein